MELLPLPNNHSTGEMESQSTQETDTTPQAHTFTQLNSVLALSLHVTYRPSANLSNDPDHDTSILYALLILEIKNV